MRKLIVFAILLVSTILGYSQNVDNFEVGPYEVDYKGEGDFKCRLRPNIDLYEYFGLKKDTLIVIPRELSPVGQAIQVNGFMNLPRLTERGSSNLFGIDGSWKKKIGNVIYFNAGLSLGISYGRYNVNSTYLQDVDVNLRGDTASMMFSFSSVKKVRFVMLEVGVPLSIEFAKLDRSKASLFASIGVTPLWYNTLEAKIVEPISQKGMDIDKEEGFLVAPRIDVGGYVPVGGRMVRIGIYGEYRIHCFGDMTIFNKMGQEFVGANVGLVF